MRKNHENTGFSSHGRYHECLMHDSKNNMMLCEWCHEHCLGANQMSAFVIGSSSFKYEWWLLMKIALLCNCVCLCVCVCVCVCVSVCVVQFVEHSA